MMNRDDAPVMQVAEEHPPTTNMVPVRELDAEPASSNGAGVGTSNCHGDAEDADSVKKRRRTDMPSVYLGTIRLGCITRVHNDFDLRAVGEEMHEPA